MTATRQLLRKRLNDRLHHPEKAVAAAHRAVDEARKAIAEYRRAVQESRESLAGYRGRDQEGDNDR